METIVADTNVLVRFLIEENLAQTRRARELFRTHHVNLPETVFLETEWVLRFIYEVPRQEIVLGLRSLFKLRNVHVDRNAMMLNVINAYESGFDFADALHHGSAEGLEVKTFDRKFVNRAKKNGWKVSLV
ncbi:MAG: putative nucleic-acid-binding protein [Akkermansiaceae bacterium]|jgi:predicted nucleic-acid-binding protein